MRVWRRRGTPDVYKRQVGFHAAHGRITVAGKHRVQKLAAQRGVIQQRAVPIPQDRVENRHGLTPWSVSYTHLNMPPEKRGGCRCCRRSPRFSGFLWPFKRLNAGIRPEDEYFC